jgi:ABC-type lipoprotein export system ATPase subunit
MIDTYSISSPYPGLRPFRRQESDLFFGREECIATMVDRLESSRFLAVLGASGSGKSSLVKVGLIEALERGSLQEAGRRASQCTSSLMHCSEKLRAASRLN